jgi:hypothetical protein
MCTVHAPLWGTLLASRSSHATAGASQHKKPFLRLYFMARKISVRGVSGTLEKQQLKRSVAQLLVRRQELEWEVPNRIARRRPLRQPRILLPREPRRRQAYIPEKLPQAEVEGCVFQAPDRNTPPNHLRLILLGRTA